MQIRVWFPHEYLWDDIPRPIGRDVILAHKNSQSSYLSMYSVVSYVVICDTQIRPHRFSEAWSFLDSPPSCAPPTQPSRARSWQPLHTPRLSVSLRCRKRSNSSLALRLKVTVAAQPEKTIRQHSVHKYALLIYRLYIFCAPHKVRVQTKRKETWRSFP